VVYGLLNQNDTVHVIKLNKAFLGNENAYTMAKVSDSLFYKNATVTLEKIKDGSNIKTINLIPVYYPKDTGIFATDKNIVYVTHEKLDSSCIYNLNINIPGKAPITSSTSLISGLTVLNPVDYAANTIGFDTTSSYEVSWNSTPGARLYELTLRFNYYEILNGDTTLHHLDWVQNSTLSSTLAGGEPLSLDISGSSFFQFIANKIRPVQGIIRIASQKTLDFIFLAGGDDLSTYIEVSSPSNTIVQEKPFYTNISNGIGLFSSKFDKTIKGKELSSNTIDLLAKCRFTKNLRFLDYYNSFPYWNILHK